MCHYRRRVDVLAAVWDLGLVGVVGCADHRAGRRYATTAHHAAAGLTRGQTLLLQIPLTCAGGAALGVGCWH